jgi:hypothetical protein
MASQRVVHGINIREKNVKKINVIVVKKRLIVGIKKKMKELCHIWLVREQMQKHGFYVYVVILGIQLLVELLVKTEVGVHHVV